MHIEIEFDIFNNVPEFIELKDLNGKFQTIKWDDEPTINGDILFIEEAYFLGTDSEKYDNETEYLYQNIIEISNEWERDIVYKRLIFTDNAGDVIATFEDNEENPMTPKLLLAASWERNSDNQKVQSENVITNKDELKDPLLAPITKMLDLNKNFVFHGNEYYGFEHISSIEESLSPKEKLALLAINNKKRTYTKKKVKEEIAR